MRSVYILSNHGKLSKEGEHLIFKDFNAHCTKILPAQTERIFVVGNSSITGEAMSIIMRAEIPVTYISHSGKCMGHISYNEGKNVFLRKKQFERERDETKSLNIAKSIVRGKIRNQIAFMQRIKRSRIVDFDIMSIVNSIKNFLKDISRCENKESLRGIEGNAAKHYFSVLRMNILPEWAVFTERSRNPPETNVNAVLSFFYSLLKNYVKTAIVSCGLDPMIGNLHSLVYGQDTLAFDLMEEFRTPVADTLTCTIFNKNVLHKDDFREVEVSGKRGVYLTTAGIKKVCACFEQKIRSSVLYEMRGEKLSFFQIMVEQAKQYKKVIIKEDGVYKPFYYK